MATILRQERVNVVMHDVRVRSLLENMKKEKLKTL